MCFVCATRLRRRAVVSQFWASGFSEWRLYMFIQMHDVYVLQMLGVCGRFSSIAATPKAAGSWVCDFQLLQRVCIHLIVLGKTRRTLCTLRLDARELSVCRKSYDERSDDC